MQQQHRQHPPPEQSTGKAWAEDFATGAAADAPAGPADGAAWAAEFGGQTGWLAPALLLRKRP